jgi:predicted porin
MKKSLIALAVLAASGAAMAQSSVTLFGIVDTGFGYVKNSGGDKKIGLTTSGNATSRLGFRGVEDLGGGLKAGFWLEGQLDGDVGNAAGFDFRRRSTISLAGNFGEVRMGRELTPGYVKTSSYDMFGQVGMGQFLGWSQSLSDFAGDINGVRSSNMLSYYTPNFGGFTAALGYGFGESQVSNSADRYIGGYVAYDNGPLSVSFAYDKKNLTTALLDLDRKQWSLGGSYDLGMLKASALFQEVKLDEASVLETGKIRNWMLGVSAPVGPGTIKGQYASYKLRHTDEKAHQLSLGYVYDMSKRTAVYGTVSFLKNKGDAAVELGGNGLALNSDMGRNQSGFQVGIRHAF